MIKYIAFDLGGVLVENKESDLERELSSILGIDSKVLRLASSDFKPLTTTGEMSLLEFYEGILEKLHLDTTTPQNLLETHLKIHESVLTSRNERVVDIVKKLKEKHHVISLSNVEREIMESTRRNGLYDLFEENFISVEMGMKKPDFNIYRKMLLDLGVKPSEVVFIDDKQENVDAGNYLGIISLRYENPDQLLGSLRQLSLL